MEKELELVQEQETSEETAYTPIYNMTTTRTALKAQIPMLIARLETCEPEGCPHIIEAIKMIVRF